MRAAAAFCLSRPPGIEKRLRTVRAFLLGRPDGFAREEGARARAGLSPRATRGVGAPPGSSRRRSSTPGRASRRRTRSAGSGTRRAWRVVARRGVARPRREKAGFFDGKKQTMRATFSNSRRVRTRRRSAFLRSPSQLRRHFPERRSTPAVGTSETVVRGDGDGGALRGIARSLDAGGVRGRARARWLARWTLADPARGAFRARVVVVVSRRRDDRLAIAETATLAFARRRATSVRFRARGASRRVRPDGSRDVRGGGHDRGGAHVVGRGALRAHRRHGPGDGARVALHPPPRIARVRRRVVPAHAPGRRDVPPRRAPGPRRDRPVGLGPRRRPRRRGRLRRRHRPRVLDPGRSPRPARVESCRVHVFELRWRNTQLRRNSARPRTRRHPGRPSRARRRHGRG